MAAYLFAEVNALDPAAYEEYRRRVPAVVAAHGGRYLARGRVGELLEGEAPPNGLAIIEFPDMARLKAFYRSAEYQPLIEIRQRTARARLLAIEGV